MKTIITALLMSIVSVSVAQQKHNYSVIKPSEWIIPNSGGVTYSMDTYKGEKALILKKNFNAPKNAWIAYPKGLNFTNG